MENRRKFYTGGLWSKDDFNEKYEHIKWVLYNYNQNNLDEDELKFIIKNAFVSKIYISEGVKNKYTDKDFGAQSGLFKKIAGGNNTVLGTNVFDICKAVENRGEAYNTGGIIIEHVVPAKVYLEDVKKKYSNRLFTKNEFQKIFDAVSICLITKEEDNRLRQEFKSKGSGYYTLVSKMPEGYEDYIKFPFARYDNKLGAGIKIYGWTIKGGKLEKP